MDTVVVFEDPATKQRQEGEPYVSASTLDARCLCGGLVHPFPDAWCRQCGARVVEIRQQESLKNLEFTLSPASRSSVVKDDIQ